MELYKRIIILVILAFASGSAMPFCFQKEYAASSVLSSGQWFRIAVRENGIYRIDFSKLRQLGLTNPSNPRIFGNNSGQLSYYNDDPSPDDLREISIYLSKGSDGVFNEGDYLLFYGEGTNRWKYNYSSGGYDFIRHNYSDTAYYFITSSATPGRMIGNAAEITGSTNYTSGTSDVLYNHELETENLIKSGREWYQPQSSITGTSVTPGFKELIPGEKINYRIRVLGRSPSPSMFRFYEGSTLHLSIMVPEVNMFSTTGIYASDVLNNGSLTPSSQSPVFEMKFFNNNEQGAMGWIDYVRLQGRAAITYTGKSAEFSDYKSIAPGRITEFNVKSTINGFSVWDISDPFNPEILSISKSGDNNRFRLKTDSMKKFIIFSPESAAIPNFRTAQVAKQDLHGSEPADMIIVTHPLFLKYAEKLKEIHFRHNGLVSMIVTPEEIYNEFSGGVPDIAAIRNFLRMKFDKQKGTDHPLQYLLLFGDGSYENKTPATKNPNFIPTYQSLNSLIVVSSFTSDDFYGLLEAGEGEADGTEDIGIGRFPVADTSQASIMVSKVSRYLSEDSYGDWKNVIAISADDEDGNTHMNDAEGLYSLLNSTYSDFNVDKIYLDAYKQVTMVNGQSYPDVTSAINDRINAGCLIFDYLGHGNELGLAHERVVKTENINSWRNGSKLPLFITATCEFSRFDDIEINKITGDMPGKISAGEMVILNPDGGGIALMTTTRVVYSAPNYTLNRNILKYAFTLDENGNALGLGDIIRLAKLNSGSGMNKRNFLLLGDPAIKLAWPWHGKIVTDSINSVGIAQPVDTLKALSVVTISGHVENNNGSIMSKMDGYIYPVVFDKIRKVKTLANDGGQVMEFDIRNSILFSGKAHVARGKFSFSFIVPKDIDYSYGKGKISYYATMGYNDMGGSFSDLIVGGFSKIAGDDTEGPEIDLYLNDTLFKDGGISDENPVLLGIIRDAGGINTTGAGIGHDLTAYIDENRNNSFVLNNYFETALGSYSEGMVTYPLYDIDPGTHSLTLKAWDNYNNSSEAKIKFVVRTDNGFIINNLINYPNPFTDHTSITAEHNRPDDELFIRICIYNISGNLIRIIEELVPTSGYRLPPVVWDGNSEGGKRVGRGVYPYSVLITTSSGETTRASGRMIIL